MTEQSKKKENRGGKREGAGRKRRSTESFSAEKLGELNDRIEAYADDKGKHIDEVALEIVYDDKQNVSARMKAYDTLKKYSTIQAKEGGEADQELGPEVYLPEQDKGPELKVVEGGK